MTTSLIYVEVITIFLVGISCIEGVSLTLNGSLPHAMFNKSFTIVCTVHQAAGLNDMIAFNKKNVLGMFAVLSQDGGSCSVFSPPVPRYNNRVHCGAGTNTSAASSKQYVLVIRRTSVEHDATQWWCSLYKAEKRSPNLHLEVYAPLIEVTITTMPAFVIAGVVTVLECRTSPSFPAASIVWISNGNVVSRGVNSTTEVTSRGLIVTVARLSSVYSLDQNGIYVTCLASYNETKLVSYPYQLKIVAKSATAVNCTDHGPYEKPRAEITCRLLGTIHSGLSLLRPNRGGGGGGGGEPQEVLRCNRNNSRCLKEPGYSYVVSPALHTTVLTIDSLDPHRDIGEWICRDGTRGISQSKCNLTIIYGPTAVEHKLPGFLREGSDVTINCSNECRPPCTYSWLLEGKQIATRPMLNLTNIDRTQDGNEYQCIVLNFKIPKSITQRYLLNVTYGPDKVILHPGPHQNVQLGQNLTVSCSAVCKPPCNVSWTVGSRLVSSDSLLTLQDIQKDEELNVYKCTAFNPVTAKYRSDYFMLHISLNLEYKMSQADITISVVGLLIALAIPAAFYYYRRMKGQQKNKEDKIDIKTATATVDRESERENPAFIQLDEIMKQQQKNKDEDELNITDSTNSNQKRECKNPAFVELEEKSNY